MSTGNKVKTKTLSGMYYRSQYTNGRLTFTQDQSIVAGAMYPQGKAWVGGDDPLWRQKVLARTDATNTYEYTLYRPVTELQYFNAGYIGMFSSTIQERVRMRRAFVADLTAQTGIDLSLRAAATNSATGKFYNKVLAHTQSVNGWAFLGELRETIHMLKHPAESLAKLAETYAKNVALNKQRFSKRKQRILAQPVRGLRQAQRKRRMMNKLLYQERTLASNLWLEFRFGVEPLANDIANAAIAVYDYSNNYKGEVKVITARELLEGSTNSLGGDENLFNFHWDRKLSYERETKVKIVGAIKLNAYYAGQTAAQVLGSRFDLSLPALVPAVWDLLPLSVFVDYFVNVNDVITASVVQIPELAYLHRCVREEVTATTVVEPSFHNLYSEDFPLPVGGFSKVSKVHYLREKWVLGIPSLAFTTPLSSPIRLTNLLAFLNNVIK